jgi:RNA polymerase sigma-70 factor (ECF subfamily)
MTTVQDDLDLANAIASGDEGAANRFAEKFRPRLVYLARKRRIPASDYEDVAHDALLAAINQLRRGLFRGESKLSTWLERILSGKLADYWRRIKTKELPSSFGEGTDAELTDAADGELAYVQSDMVLSLAVQEVLSKMSVKHRRILLLNQMDGYTTKEISKMLGWPTGTIGRILAEAKVIFRDLVLGAEEFKDERRQGR